MLGSPADEEFQHWDKIFINFDKILFNDFKNFKAIDLKRNFSSVNDIENLLDLLKKMLDYIPTRRITASEALKHPFFKNLK